MAFLRRAPRPGRSHTARPQRLALTRGSVIALAAFMLSQTASHHIAHAVELAPIEVAEPPSYKLDDYRSPVPKTLAGGHVLDAAEAEAHWKAKSAVFIDVFPQAPKPPNLPAGTVWRDPVHMTIDGAHWLPNVGYGNLSVEAEAAFKARLTEFSGASLSKPLVFFCLKNCWMSWNAAKRAVSYGYTQVLWFSEGTDAWQESGNDLVKAQPLR